MNLDTDFIHFIRINSKQVINININVKYQTIQFLECNIGENLGDQFNDLDITTKA